VAVGLFPAIAAWGATVMLGTVTVSGGSNLLEIVRPQPAAVAAVEAGQTPRTPTVPPKSSAEVNGFLVHGLLLMERGFIFTCMILAAASACLIDRKFNAAAVWMLVAALCTGLGLMHAYQVYEVDIAPGVKMATFDYLFQFIAEKPGAFAYRAYDIALGYLLAAGTFWWAGHWAQDQKERLAH
jgi:AGZA family xanthine/uracil permease-like MFS transporter